MAGCKSVQDLMLAQSKFMNLGMTQELVGEIFGIFKSEAMKAGYASDDIETTFKLTNTFHFNMFVLGRKDFDTYMRVIHETVMQSVQYIDDN